MGFENSMNPLDGLILWDRELFQDVHHDGQDGDVAIRGQDCVRQGGDQVGTLLGSPDQVTGTEGLHHLVHDLTGFPGKVLCSLGRAVGLDGGQGTVVGPGSETTGHGVPGLLVRGLTHGVHVLDHLLVAEQERGSGRRDALPVLQDLLDPRRGAGLLESTHDAGVDGASHLLHPGRGTLTEVVPDAAGRVLHLPLKI